MELNQLQRHIKVLVSLGESDASVLSCYLNLEAGGARVYLSQRAALLRKTFTREAEREDLEFALSRIENYLAGRIHPETKGVALFVRGGSQPFFLPLQFRVPFQNSVAASPRPNIYQLVEIKDNYHRYAVMVASETSVRILGVNLGAVTETVSGQRPEPRRRAGRGWTKEHYQNHVRERTNRFLHEGIQALERLALAGGYRHLILAGHPRVTARIREALPKQLAESLVDIVHAAPGDADSDVVRATLLSFIEQEEQESLAMVERLLEAISTDGLAVAGAPATWEMLKARQADVLILAKPFQPPRGWLCTICEAMGPEPVRPERCPRCGESDFLPLDVKEALVHTAERTGCSVEVVNQSDALMNLGGVGCLLRYFAPQQYLRRAA
jgi:protein required for attachment to host cells